MDKFEKWDSDIARWSRSANSVPRFIREDIVKSKIDFSKPTKPLSLFEDPFLAMQYSLGFKDRLNSVSYITLRQITRQLSVIGAIINTRCNQVASFSVPFRHSKSLGFVIKHKDPTHEVTAEEAEKIRELEDFIYRCGAPDPNPHNPNARDDFETFLKKIVRDSLTYDAACFEIVPDRLGTPYEFLAVDASTIRYAAKDLMDGDSAMGVSMSPPSQLTSKTYKNPLAAPYRYIENPKRFAHIKKPDFVQVLNEQIETVFSRKELAYGVRNPRTDLYSEGYGYSELEMLITIITSHLNAETYNAKFFTNHSAPKGILNFKGENFTPDQIEGFKREWKANVEGVQNSWRTPILNSDMGVEFIDLQRSNEDMQFASWLEYLIKIATAVYLIDPAEINFDLHGGVSQTPLFESSNEGKLKQSRDRGLRPLLRFIAKMINTHIIAQIDDHFVFDFVGLDELSEQEKQEQYQKQVTTTHTINEIRLAQDLPAVEYGDYIESPVYLQIMQFEQQKKQEQMAAEQAGTAEGDTPAQEETTSTPQYADSIDKSIDK